MTDKYCNITITASSLELQIITFTITTAVLATTLDLGYLSPQGLKAIHSPHTGIIDWGLVTKYYGKQFEKLGGTIYTDFEVDAFSPVAESAGGSGDGLLTPVRIESKSKQVCWLAGWLRMGY